MRRSIFYRLTVIVESKIMEIVYPSFILEYISIYTDYTSSSYALKLTCIKDNLQCVIKRKRNLAIFLVPYYQTLLFWHIRTIQLSNHVARWNIHFIRVPSFIQRLVYVLDPLYFSVQIISIVIFTLLLLWMRITATVIIIYLILLGTNMCACL